MHNFECRFVFSPLMIYYLCLHQTCGMLHINAYGLLKVQYFKHCTTVHIWEETSLHYGISQLDLVHRSWFNNSRLEDANVTFKERGLSYVADKNDMKDAKK
jgi:hypothetical protein